MAVHRAARIKIFTYACPPLSSGVPKVITGSPRSKFCAYVPCARLWRRMVWRKQWGLRGEKKNVKPILLLCSVWCIALWPHHHHTYLVFWEQLVLCTVLRRRKNHFKNQNSCFFFQNQEALVCKPLFPHVSNAFSQQPLSYWQKCYSLNLSETRTLIRWVAGLAPATCRNEYFFQKMICFIFQPRLHCRGWPSRTV